MKKRIFLILLMTSVLLSACQNSNEPADDFVSEVINNKSEPTTEESITQEPVTEENLTEFSSEGNNEQKEEEDTEKQESRNTDETEDYEQEMTHNTSYENPDGDDFNTDGLMMDKVRIEDFSYLYDKGLTYYNHVELQARLSRYLDYYVPSEDDQIWTASIVTEEGFADVPELYQFYVYIEELDATIQCKIYKDEEVLYPYRFSCEKIDHGENE